MPSEWNPIETLDIEAQWSCLVGEQSMCGECDESWLHKERTSSCAPNPLRPCPRWLFIGLVLICILHTKAVFLSSVRCSGKYQTWICNQLVRSAVLGLGSSKFVGSIRSKGSIVGDCAPELMESTLTLGGQGQNWITLQKRSFRSVLNLSKAWKSYPSIIEILHGLRKRASYHAPVILSSVTRLIAYAPSGAWATLCLGYKEGKKKKVSGWRRGLLPKVWSLSLVLS